MKATDCYVLFALPQSYPNSHSVLPDYVLIRVSVSSVQTPLRASTQAVCSLRLAFIVKLEVFFYAEEVGVIDIEDRLFDFAYIDVAGD